MTYSCFFFLRSAVYNLPLVALACLLTGDARGDLILAGQFAQNAGQILNDKFLAIDAYLMDLGPAIATQSSISVPSYVNPGTPGDDIISAGSQLQSVPEPSAAIMAGFLSIAVLLRRYRRATLR